MMFAEALAVALDVAEAVNLIKVFAGNAGVKIFSCAYPPVLPNDNPIPSQ